MVDRVIEWLRKEQKTTNGIMLAVFLALFAPSLGVLRWLFIGASALAISVPTYDLVMSEPARRRIILGLAVISGALAAVIVFALTN